ncbi:efflux RND transporter periplasmic adaptor subunit [Vibrio hepatarius]|uniref:efflux RND transporter periplasmic adaptor subunit n=1 Tax=Vibrio hepatarius TaxID=171383 RepID=UPI001C09BA05|nr:efflux RND transporter periplasmic adaptor subunit [Vibrio hepatarius]MBU2897766.1 efflux RND transporter periplasmic adaptor subunit [Vibrio hepatarius]
MAKSWLITIASVAFLGGGIFVYLQSSVKPETLPTLIVEKGTIEKQAMAVGKIVPSHAISIKSPIEGIVGEIYVQVGQVVKQGQPLVKVSPNPTPQELTDASTNLMRSEAELESAKQKLANLAKLLKQGVIPSNYDEYVSARSEVKSAKADVLQKRQNLELIQSGEALIGDKHLTSTLVAPINGTVLNRKIEVGEPIISTASSQAASELMSLADMNSVIFKGSVSEHDAAKLKPGMLATLSVAPYPDLEILGVLTKVAIQSEKLNTPDDTNTSKSFDNGFEIEVGELRIPDKITLRSGFSSTAKIILEKSQDVLTLPERALKFTGNTPSVLISDGSDEGFHQQKIVLGLSDGINVEVLEGVSLGEEIIDNSMMGNNHD